MFQRHSKCFTKPSLIFIVSEIEWTNSIQTGVYVPWMWSHLKVYVGIERFTGINFQIFYFHTYALIKFICLKTPYGDFPPHLPFLPFSQCERQRHTAHPILYHRYVASLFRTQSIFLRVRKYRLVVKCLDCRTREHCG